MGRMQRGQSASAAGRRGFMSRRLQGLPNPRDDQAAHQAGLAEPHFGLRRVDVDVDVGGVAFDEQRQRAVAVARQIVEIGASAGARDQLVAHAAAVDEHELVQGVGLVVGGQPDPAVKRHAFALVIQPERVVDEFLAQRLPHPLALALDALGAGGIVEGGSYVGGEAETRLRVGEREPAHPLRAGLRLGAVGLQEFQPRRRRRE